jgi:hypothetical protein
MWMFQDINDQSTFFSTITIADFKKMAQKRGISSLSKLKKADLVAVLSQ